MVKLNINICCQEQTRSVVNRMANFSQKLIFCVVCVRDRELKVVHLRISYLFSFAISYDLKD